MSGQQHPLPLWRAAGPNEGALKDEPHEQVRKEQVLMTLCPWRTTPGAVKMRASDKLQAQQNQVGPNCDTNMAPVPEAKTTCIADSVDGRP